MSGGEPAPHRLAEGQHRPPAADAAHRQSEGRQEGPGCVALARRQAAGQAARQLARQAVGQPANLNFDAPNEPASGTNCYCDLKRTLSRYYDGCDDRTRILL